MTIRRVALAAVRHGLFGLRLPALGVLALGVIGLNACITGGGASRPLAVPEFARLHGSWVPERLHRDLIQCLDEAHQGVLSNFRQFRAAGTARRALSDNTSACMARAGWVRRHPRPPREISDE